MENLEVDEASASCIWHLASVQWHLASGICAVLIDQLLSSPFPPPNCWGGRAGNRFMSGSCWAKTECSYRERLYLGRSSRWRGGEGARDPRGQWSSAVPQSPIFTNPQGVRSKTCYPLPPASLVQFEVEQIRGTKSQATRRKESSLVPTGFLTAQFL